MTPFEIFLHEEGLQDEPSPTKRLLKLAWKDGHRRGWDEAYEAGQSEGYAVGYEDAFP